MIFAPYCYEKSKPSDDEDNCHTNRVQVEGEDRDDGDDGDDELVELVNKYTSPFGL
jgi:hypothetical protein